MSRTSLALALGVGVLFVSANFLHAAESDEVTILVKKDSIEFKIGAKRVTEYFIGPTVAKPYFWPLLAPNEVPVTRAWPMVAAAKGDTTDHVHQKSMWFCHGDVIPEGVAIKEKIKHVDGVDFWSETKGHGKMVVVEVGQPVTGKGHGAITTRNEWRTSDGVPILSETRTIHLYALPTGRLLVLESTLKAEVPITFGDTKEGSLGVRVHDQISANVGKGVLTNAAGKVGEREIWGQASPWCDYSGKVHGQAAGIAIFDHPANPYPAHWHARGYGLMAANPFGRAKSGFPGQKGKTDLVQLGKGQTLKLRYGVYLHAGDVREGKVAEAFEAFTKLPQ